MSISFQTNYAALVAENNLNTNNKFQTQTIEALTSGYRINQSGDDPAGLAVANQYQSEITELTQGVLNGNAGVSSLQIADGGLSNITTILDRLQTLATESASSTFTGDRGNVNVEYQQLVQQITQQADNIGLGAGGYLNVQNQVYIGGGNTAPNSQIEIDLSGAENQVDASGLKLTNTSVLGGGTELTAATGNAVRLDAPGATFLNTTTTPTAAQSFTFNIVSGGAPTTVTATVNGAAGGISESDVLTQLNGTLSQYGINASVDGNGQLNFGGTTAFTVTTALTAAPPDIIANTTATGSNNGVYSVAGGDTYTVGGNGGSTGVAETLTLQNAQGTASFTLTGNLTLAQTLAQIDVQSAPLGIYAVADAAGTGISFQSTNNFTATSDQTTGTLSSATETAAPPTTAATATGNALQAIQSINTAIAQLGNVQSRVGAGENVLSYAISLANSQITNFSSAESDIRDANVATEAANLTKAQVIQQASVAALAQANATPQALLKLLQ